MKRLGLTMVLAAMLAAPASASAQVADADCTIAGWPDGGFLASSGNEFATTFKVINGGRLAGAKIFMENEGFVVNGLWTVRIRPVSPSLVPTNGVLAETSLTESQVPVGDAGEEVELVAWFPNPPLVPTGGVYALTLVHSGGSVRWAGYGEKYYEGIPPPCANSRTYVRPDNNPDAPFTGAPLTTRENYDLKFVTYLTNDSFACAGGAAPVSGSCPPTVPKADPPPKKKPGKKKGKRKKGKRKK